MIVVIIVISVIIIIAITITITTIVRSPNEPTPDCSLTSLDDIPSMLDGGRKCTVNGNDTGLYYYGPENFVLSSVQTSVSSVCVDDQECIDAITSDDCNGTIPMARIGTVKYYPFSMGNTICDSN